MLFAFSSGGYENVRLVPFQAAMSVAWGLSHDDAIKALTINAAKIFGADKAIGTLEAGKIANLVVVSGDPLEIRSRIQHVVIAGRDIPLESKHTELFKRYMGQAVTMRSHKREHDRMRRTRVRSAVQCAAVLDGCTLAFGPLGAATPAGPLYAIKGAQIHTAAGAPIDSGTIVMRNGVIEDVGANVTAPADAIVIDGAGMNVYPGLIDMDNAAPLDTRRSARPPRAVARRRRRRRRGGAGAQTFATLEEAERAKRAADHAAAISWRRTTCGRRAPALQAARERRRHDACWRCRRSGIFKGQSALVNVAIPPDDPQISTLADYRDGPRGREVAGRACTSTWPAAAAARAIRARCSARSRSPSRASSMRSGSATPKRTTREPAPRGRGRWSSRRSTR